MQFSFKVQYNFLQAEKAAVSLPHGYLTTPISILLSQKGYFVWQQGGTMEPAEIPTRYFLPCTHTILLYLVNENL